MLCCRARRLVALLLLHDTVACKALSTKLNELLGSKACLPHPDFCPGIQTTGLVLAAGAGASKPPLHPTHSSAKAQRLASTDHKLAASGAASNDAAVQSLAQAACSGQASGAVSESQSDPPAARALHAEADGRAVQDIGNAINRADAERPQQAHAMQQDVARSADEEMPSVSEHSKLRMLPFNR